MSYQKQIVFFAVACPSVVLLGDYGTAVKRSAPDGSKEADALDVLAVLVDDYENTRWPIEVLDPIETIKAHMVATGRNQADLAQIVGSRSRASEVIGRKRALTLGMIRNFS